MMVSWRTLAASLAKNPQLLISLFAFVTIILAIGTVTYLYSQKSAELLYDQAFKELRTITAMKHHKLTLFFSYRMADIRALASSETVINLASALEKQDRVYDRHDGTKPPPYEKAVHIQQKYRHYLSDYLKEYVYTHALLVDATHGHVMFSTNPRVPADTNLRAETMQRSALTQLWNAVTASRTAEVGDIRFDRRISPEPVILLAAPVTIGDTLRAVLILQLPGNAVNEIMHFQSGMGEFGESYAVGEDHLMRSDSYLAPKRFTVVNSFTHPDSVFVRTPAVQRALSGQSGTTLMTDYRGVSVLCAYLPYRSSRFTWAILSEIDESYLSGKIHAVQQDLYLLALLIAALISVIAYLAIRIIIRVSVVRPLEQSYQRASEFAAIIERSLNEIYIFDSRSFRYSYANRGALLNTGYSLQSLRTMSPWMLKPEIDEQRFMALMGPLLRGEKEQITFETVHKRRDGSRYNVDIRLQAMSGGETTTFVSIVNDITRRVKAQEQQEHFYRLSTRDHLTAIYNRQKFDELYAKEIARTRRYPDTLALILFDIDHFKSINDTYGHQAGDRVLQQLAEYVGKSLRGSDIFARWGGEEFVILMPHTPLEAARRKAEQLRREIMELQIENVGNVTCSFGVTAVNPFETAAENFRHVDEILYRAKEEGRNRVCVAEEGGEG